MLQQVRALAEPGQRRREHLAALLFEPVGDAPPLPAAARGAGDQHEGLRRDLCAGGGARRRRSPPSLRRQARRDGSGSMASWRASERASRSASSAPRASRGASLRMSAAEIATQPAVGVRPGRARWKKIALPRPLHAAAEIVVEDEDEVVERVVAPHAVRAVGGGQADGAIVAPARRVLAPALVAPQRPQRHAAGRRAAAVGAVIAPQQSEPPGRRRAVALALVAHDPRRPERASDAQRPGDQPAARAIRRRAAARAGSSAEAIRDPWRRQ